MVLKSKHKPIPDLSDEKVLKDMVFKAVAKILANGYTIEEKITEKYNSKNELMYRTVETKKIEITIDDVAKLYNFSKGISESEDLNKFFK